LTVYNTVAAGSGATAVVPGIYVYNGSSWTRSSASIAPVIITQPKAFSWSQLYEQYGDPNGPETATIAPLSVTAAGPGTLTYQWYQKSANRNAPDIMLTGTSATTATYTPDVTSWGMKSYYCVVKNGIGSVVSAIADVAIGCGAKTNQGRWLRFMCYNLGADTSLSDPFTYKSDSDTTSKDIKGWLFQWGRIADGHQWRSSELVAGPYISTTDIEVPDTDATFYGKFITNTDMSTFADWRTPQYDMAWRNSNDITRTPCPSGWRIPTSDEWGSIYREGSSYGRPAAATANTWTWSKGYLLKPDGVTTTLFLPAAGHRFATGPLGYISGNGQYWCSPSASSYAFFLHINNIAVNPAISYPRAGGSSVRCISETYD
jgi:uncharacterized protein (TIGR02145 family)